MRRPKRWHVERRRGDRPWEVVATFEGRGARARAAGRAATEIQRLGREWRIHMRAERIPKAPPIPEDQRG